jgi:hypothetical protein
MSKILLVIFLHTASGDKAVVTKVMPSIATCQTQAALIWANNKGTNLDAYCYYVEGIKHNG